MYSYFPAFSVAETVADWPWLRVGVFFPAQEFGSAEVDAAFVGAEQIWKSCGRPTLVPFVTLNVTAPALTVLVERAKTNSVGLASVTVTVVAAVRPVWASATGTATAANRARKGAASSDLFTRGVSFSVVVVRAEPGGPPPGEPTEAPEALCLY